MGGGREGPVGWGGWDRTERHWKAGCCPAEQKIVVQWSNYTCRCSHIYDEVDGANAESWLPWRSLVSVLTSRGPFLCWNLYKNITSTAVSSRTLPPASLSPPSAISLSLMPSTVSSEMQAWPRLLARGTQFTMAGEKLSGPKSQRKTGGLNAALSPAAAVRLICATFSVS